MSEIVTRFRWTCSYFGCVDYAAHHASGHYVLTLRQAAGDYERSIYNGSDAEWQREVVASIGILQNHHHPDNPLPPGLVADFNRWRKSDHDRFIAHMTAHPERYGEPGTFGSLAAPPMIAEPGQYIIGEGWIRLPFSLGTPDQSAKEER